jgi:hypothetical protein
MLSTSEPYVSCRPLPLRALTAFRSRCGWRRAAGSPCSSDARSTPLRDTLEAAYSFASRSSARTSSRNSLIVSSVGDSAARRTTGSIAESGRGRAGPWAVSCWDRFLPARGRCCGRARPVGGSCGPNAVNRTARDYPEALRSSLPHRLGNSQELPVSGATASPEPLTIGNAHCPPPAMTSQ